MVEHVPFYPLAPLLFVVSAIGIAYVDRLSDSGARKHAE